MFFMQYKLRLKFYAQKCSLYTKQLDFIKKEMNLEISQNEENEGKYIYNYLQDIVWDRIVDPRHQSPAVPLVVQDQIKVDLARTNTTPRVKSLEGQ